MNYFAGVLLSAAEGKAGEMALNEILGVLGMSQEEDPFDFDAHFDEVNQKLDDIQDDLTSIKSTVETIKQSQKALKRDLFDAEIQDILRAYVPPESQIISRFEYFKTTIDLMSDESNPRNSAKNEYQFTQSQEFLFDVQESMHEIAAFWLGGDLQDGIFDYLGELMQVNLKSDMEAWLEDNPIKIFGVPIKDNLRVFKIHSASYTNTLVNDVLPEFHGALNVLLQGIMMLEAAYKKNPDMNIDILHPQYNNIKLICERMTQFWDSYIVSGLDNKMIDLVNGFQEPCKITISETNLGTRPWTRIEYRGSAGDPISYYHDSFPTALNDWYSVHELRYQNYVAANPVKSIILIPPDYKFDEDASNSFYRLEAAANGTILLHQGVDWNFNINFIYNFTPKVVQSPESYFNFCESLADVALYDPNQKTTYEIGDEANGGVVFYVDETGEHGLVAAKGDIGLYIWEEAMNKCTEITLHGYRDWYLPSKNELNLVYTNLHRAGLGDFVEIGYWSSTQVAGDCAWTQNFGLPKGSNTFKSQRKKEVTVLTIRSF